MLQDIVRDPDATYNILKDSGLFEKGISYDNNVPKGTNPQIRDTFAQGTLPARGEGKRPYPGGPEGPRTPATQTPAISSEVVLTQEPPVSKSISPKVETSLDILKRPLDPGQVANTVQVPSGPVANAIIEQLKAEGIQPTVKAVGDNVKIRVERLDSVGVSSPAQQKHRTQ